MYWSKNIEKRFIKAYPHNTDEDIAKMFKINYSFVQKKAEELGLEKSEPAKRDWTQEEVQYIQKTYENTPNGDIAEVLGVSKWQVEHIAYRIGLRKSKEYMSKIPDDNNDLVMQWEDEWSKEMGCSRGHYITGKVLRHLFPYHRIEQEQPIGSLWVDWLIPHLNIAVEVHGSQHLSFNGHFHKTKYDFIKGQENDWQKSEMLESQNISLIVIYHDEDISINLIEAKLEEVF